jgi:hypothetical protein
MSETSKTKTIKEKLWNISENPYYKKNPETGQYEVVDEDTLEKVRKQEQDEYKEAQEIIDKKNAQILDDHIFLEEYKEKQRLDQEKKKNNYMQNAGRKKRRTGRRKSNKRKSNKRKSHKRRGSRRR